MKIKIDFVTNSSSVSFCMWGLLTSIHELPDDVMKNIYSYYWNNTNDDKRLTYDEFKTKGAVIHYFEEMCYQNGIEYFTPPYYGVYYLGRELSAMKNDETLQEFKKSTDDVLKSLGFDISDVEILEGGWYNG